MMMGSRHSSRHGSLKLKGDSYALRFRAFSHGYADTRESTWRRERVIRTVTLSPGFDHEVHVDRIDPGKVGHVMSWRVRAAGKGMNVARFVRSLEAEVQAYSLVGTLDEERFRSAAAADGVDVDTIAVPGSTRNNLTLTSDAIGPMAGHASGPRLGAVPVEAVDRLIRKLLRDIRPGDIVVLSGAVPDGIDAVTWALAAESIVAAGGDVVVDGQGAALVEAVCTGAVTMTKPNEDEVNVLPGVRHYEPVLSRAVAGLRWMLSQGVDEPVVSLGARGIVHCLDDVIMLTSCPVAEARIAVAAGDAFVAGYCVGASGQSTSKVLPVDLAVASAAAHVAGDVGLKTVRARISSIEKTVLEPL